MRKNANGPIAMARQGVAHYRMRKISPERGGFEPPVGFPTHAFQACTLNRSDTPPVEIRKKCVPVRSIRFGNFCHAARASPLKETAEESARGLGHTFNLYDDWMVVGYARPEAHGLVVSRQ